MTINGQAQLRKELESLELSLSEIADAIGEAIKHGNLSENADYHANKNKQGMVLAKNCSHKVTFSERAGNRRNKTSQKRSRRVRYDGYFAESWDG